MVSSSDFSGYLAVSGVKGGRLPGTGWFRANPIIIRLHYYRWTYHGWLGVVVKVLWSRRMSYVDLRQQRNSSFSV